MFGHSYVDVGVGGVECVGCDVVHVVVAVDYVRDVDGLVVGAVVGASYV